MALRTENIQTTLNALNQDFAGRRDTEGYDESKTIHIHRRNRAYVWSLAMQNALIDSILKGYYIPPIICSSRIINGIERREVMEGGNRITTIRRILNLQVRDLSEEERNTVRSHPITLVVMRGLTNSQQREMFRRLNKSIKVSDGQLYAMSEEDSPLVREALDLLNAEDYPLRARITTSFFDTVNMDSDGKKDLENAVALVSGALHGVKYLTKSFSRQEEVVESQDPIDRGKVVLILGLMLDVFRMADERAPLNDRRRIKAQWSIGKYLGAILYDILMNPRDIRRIQQKWADYLVLVREGHENAEDAIEIKGAQNINPDKLKRKSYKVDIFLSEDRLVTNEELATIRHSEIDASEDSDTESVN